MAERTLQSPELQAFCTFWPESYIIALKGGSTIFSAGKDFAPSQNGSFSTLLRIKGMKLFWGSSPLKFSSLR